MWPSNETRISYRELNGSEFDLKPAFTWKSVVAHVKTVAAGEFIGYGCTFKTTRDVRMAVVPIGYYDGYDRGVSNTAHVLIRGHRAKVLGRVCMNIIMVDVSDIPDVALEDEVVLIGTQEFGGVRDTVSVEQFAAWASTINYEITTRVNERILRLVIE
jgi:alanine racemase